MIRDEFGHFVAVYSGYYGEGSHNKAEFAALMQGLRLCQELQMDNVHVESDSMLVVNAILQRKINRWDLEYTFRECNALFLSSYSITHVYRERNMVADRLADWAYNHQNHKI